MSWEDLAWLGAVGEVEAAGPVCRLKAACSCGGVVTWDWEGESVPGGEQDAQCPACGKWWTVTEEP